LRIRPRQTSGTAAGTAASAGAIVGRLSALAFLACFPLALVAAAQSHPAAPAQSIPLKLPASTDTTTWTIVLVLTLLTILPALLLSMTPFVRIIIVFHFLRQALGTQTAPSNQTLLGLGLFLTYFVMQPVAAQIGQVAVTPLERHEIGPMDALDRASTPLRDFMLKFTREKDLALLTEMAHIPRPRVPEDLPMRVVIPAYILSEMKAGFQIGAVLYLPFMVVDMVVAAITTSVGMMQLPPVIISTPLKILLFVVADGWNLVVGSLLKSFY
jgi:flagellar biosynthetic protein FliP